MKILLFTYPRTGQHFLKDAMSQKLLGIEIDNTHILTNKKYDKIITLARNPIESVASFASMNLYFDTNKDIDEKRIRSVCYMSLLKYISGCEEAMGESDIIVSYDSLSKETDKTIDKIAKVLGLELSGAMYERSNIPNKIERNHLVSSKDTEYYDECLTVTAKLEGLDRAIDIYNRMIERSI
jgi:hypothetical protein